MFKRWFGQRNGKGQQERVPSVQPLGPPPPIPPMPSRKQVLITQCPRCCNPGAPADIFRVMRRMSFLKRCSDAHPCVWRKSSEEGHQLENHDMLVMVGDQLMVGLRHLEQRAVELGVITPPPAYREGFTNSTNASMVLEDMVKIVGEVTRRLRTLEHGLSTDHRRRRWPKRRRPSSKPADQPAG